jgi:hypothetical protein
MDFLNKKNYFLTFWILQHVCKTPKSVGQYSKKIQNLIFGEFYFIHHLYLDKEIPKGLIYKILLGITCYYSLLMFG